MGKNNEKLMALADLVRDATKTANDAIKILLAEGVDVQFFHNGKQLPDGVFGLDLEVRMQIPQEPLNL